MQPHLKLTEESEDQLIPPTSLLKHLESSVANFDSLLKDLNCTPEDLHQTLNDPETTDLLKLKTHLATLQLKLLAIRYIPHAFAKLVNLMNTSEKPEVARRAATTVLNIAGIATHTAPELPTAPTPITQQEKQTPNQDPPPQTPEDLQLLETVAFLYKLKHDGVDLRQLPKQKLPDLIHFLTTTCNLPQDKT